MSSNPPSSIRWAERLLIALLLIALDGLITVVFTPWGAGPMLGNRIYYLAKISTGLLLTVLR